MKVIIVNGNKKAKGKEIEYRLNLFLEWLIYMVGYAIVLLVASNLFKSLYIESFIYGFLGAVIIFALNKTIKPVLVTISLPIIGLSLGLFYFVINVVILLLTDLLLGSHFEMTGILSPFVVSIFISLFNLLLDNAIIKPLIERCKK